VRHTQHTGLPACAGRLTDWLTGWLSSCREYKVGSCISIAESSQGKDDHPELDESELEGDIL
jgi:hypothetical protein